MNIKILSFPVLSFQFNLNNVDGEATNKITPITITSIDKIINTFINFLFLSAVLSFVVIYLFFY